MERRYSMRATIDATRSSSYIGSLRGSETSSSVNEMSLLRLVRVESSAARRAASWTEGMYAWSASTKNLANLESARPELTTRLNESKTAASMRRSDLVALKSSSNMRQRIENTVCWASSDWSTITSSSEATRRGTSPACAAPRRFQMSSTIAAALTRRSPQFSRMRRRLAAV
eukprot:Amastigsp_a677343_53.p3 type:complete len:172 gc:universal Amastigsp_a677343_53:1277-1792(+)